MKIGFVLDDGLDSPDGVQQYILTLGEWFVSKGHEVHYIVGQTKRTDIPNVHSLAHNVQVRFNQNRLAMPLTASARSIKQLLGSEKFDVLHVQMPYSPQYAGRVVLLAPESTVIVGTFHILPYGGLQSMGARFLAHVNRRTIKRFHAVISVSSAAKDFAHSTMHIDSTVIPNAVNLAKFNKGKRLAKYNDNVQTMVFLGRLVERKGCLELLTAVRMLVMSGKFEKRRLVICGGGPLETKVRKYIIDNALQNFVTCVGKITEAEKPNYLASADLAVFPSKSGESFGIVLVEAIASGAKVVLGGDNPGYRFVLNDNNETLVDPNNVQDFAMKIDELLKNGKRAKELGSEQRERIADFDVNKVGAQLQDIYITSIAKVTHKHNNG